MKQLQFAFDNLKNVPEKVVRGTLLSMTDKIIKKSPVDTGRFRNNWMATIGRPSNKMTEQVDPSGTKAITESAQLLFKFEMGQTFYLTNNLPYSHRLEYGYSQQAPGGMVRTTLAEYENAIRAEVSKT